MNDPVEDLLHRLQGVRGGGDDRWTARCPAHDDQQASLSVARGDDGRALVRCHAGCSTADVAAGAGLQMRQLFVEDDTRAERWPPRRHAQVEGLPTEEQVAAWRDSLQADAEHLDLAASRKGWSPATLAALGVGWDGQRFTLPVRHTDGELAGVMRYLPDAQPKMLAFAKGHARQLYPAPPSPVGDEPVWLVEGEPDAISARELGLEAVAMPGASGFKEEHARLFASREVVVCLDADGPGRAAAAEAGRLLALAGARTRVMDLWPLRNDGRDLGDELVAANGSRALVGERLVQLASSAPILDPPVARADRRGEVVGTPMSRVKARGVRWLWRDRLPRGELSILCGLPGHGKSTWIAALAAQVTAGGERVLLISAEDSLETTVAPRMTAAGADLTRVVSIDLSLVGEKGKDSIVLPDDQDALVEYVERSGAALVIVDPVSAHLGEKVNSFSEQDVRQKALAPLARMAQARDCAVLLIAHLNKTTGGDPLSRISGSGGFGGQARAVLLLGRHPDDDPDDDASRVVIAHVKSSHGPKRRSLAFARDLVRVPTDDGGETLMPTLRELGESEVRDVDLLATMIDSDERDALNEAVDWLRVQLDGGEVPASKLLIAARKEGISEKTLRRAKRQLKVTSLQHDRQWFWAVSSGAAT